MHRTTKQMKERLVMGTHKNIYFSALKNVIHNKIKVQTLNTTTMGKLKMNVWKKREKYKTNAYMKWVLYEIYHCTISAFFANAGRPLFRFCPSGTVFASGGTFVNLRRIFIPKVCLHCTAFAKYGHVHVESSPYIIHEKMNAQI